MSHYLCKPSSNVCHLGYYHPKQGRYQALCNSVYEQIIDIDGLKYETLRVTKPTSKRLCKKCEQAEGAPRGTRLPSAFVNEFGSIENAKKHILSYEIQTERFTGKWDEIRKGLIDDDPLIVRPFIAWVLDNSQHYFSKYIEKLIYEEDEKQEIDDGNNVAN